MRLLKTKTIKNIQDLSSLLDMFKTEEIKYTLVCRETFKIIVFDSNETKIIKIKNHFLVDSLVEVKSSYPLASREYQKEDSIIKIGSSTIGSHKACIIAGPCAVESETQLMEVADDLNKIGVKFFRGGAYKPRSSAYAFQGLKQEGLDLLQKVKDKYKMKIVTELVSIENLAAVEQVADIIQIGTRNMQNFELLKAVGKSKKTILLKRGMSATINDLLLAAEYILASGNPNVILCERGIRTFETATRNTLDLNAVPMLKILTHLPVIVDPSHGTGVRELVAPMSYAAIACGADGISVEVHSKPEEALSDGPQSLKPKDFEILFNKANNLKLMCEVC